MYEFVAPHWDNLVNGPWAESIASTRLSVEQMQGWILHIYPFIYDFPKFLAEALIKVEDDFSRTFLIENIRIEKAHAEHWLWMGEGFGLDRQQMLDLAEGGTPPLRDVQSLTDWVWRVNTKGSLAEAVPRRALPSRVLRVLSQERFARVSKPTGINPAWT